ncbi:unnamed protein product, partial [marine sediment metagenome]
MKKLLHREIKRLLTIINREQRLRQQLEDEN